MALDEHIVEIARLLGGELAQAEVVEEEQVRREPAPQARKVFPTPTGPQKMTFSCWASQCRLKSSRTRARSKLTGLSHKICSKVRSPRSPPAPAAG